MPARAADRHRGHVEALVRAGAGAVHRTVAVIKSPILHNIVMKCESSSAPEGGPPRGHVTVGTTNTKHARAHTQEQTHKRARARARAHTHTHAQADYYREVAFNCVGCRANCYVNSADPVWPEPI